MSNQRYTPEFKDEAVRQWIFEVLEAHDRSPHCDSCLWVNTD